MLLPIVCVYDDNPVPGVHAEQWHTENVLLFNRFGSFVVAPFDVFLLNQILVLFNQQTLRQRTTGGEKCFLKLSSNPCQEKLFYESFNSLGCSPSRLDCPAFPTLFFFHAIYDVIIHFIPGGKIVFAKPSGTELIEFVILFNPPPTRNAIGRKYFRWRGRKFQHRLDHRYRR